MLSGAQPFEIRDIQEDEIARRVVRQIVVPSIKEISSIGGSSSVWVCRLIRRPAKDARRRREPCLGLVTRKSVWSSENGFLSLPYARRIECAVLLLGVISLFHKNSSSPPRLRNPEVRTQSAQSKTGVQWLEARFRTGDETVIVNTRMKPSKPQPEPSRRESTRLVHLD
jgi:hypothetical protein